MNEYTLSDLFDDLEEIRCLSSTIQPLGKPQDDGSK